MNVRLLLALAGLAAFASAEAAPVNLISNGSFESSSTGLPPNGTFTTLNAGSTAINGWTVGTGGIDYVSAGYWNAEDGNYSLDLSGNSAGSIFQTVTGLIAGQTYYLSFYLAGNPDGPPAMKVAVASAGTDLTHYYTVTPGTRQNMNWNQYGFYFQSAGTSATVSFATDMTNATNVTAYGPALDNVALVATPGPAGAVVFGLGLLRRRRRSK